MSATNGDIYSNHNGTNGIHHDDSSEEERDHISDLHRQRSKTEEEEEVRDDVADLDRERSKSEMSSGDDQTVPNRAFKNWYRRASVSKQLTTVEQKQLEDIPVLHEDQADGSETNGLPLRPVPSEEEQKILEAISRRLSIAKPAGTTSPLVQENVTNKLKTSSIRRGSVPQARMLKGNVKNRMAAFEKK